jgi:hypothetical protein
MTNNEALKSSCARETRRSSGRSAIWRCADLLQPASILALAALLLLAGGIVGCERSVPEGWKEMKFPVRHGEIRTGSDDTRLLVRYRDVHQKDALFREFRSALERNGYSYERAGKNNDPASGTRSAIFTRDADKIRLTVSGRGDTEVSVRKLAD